MRTYRLSLLFGLVGITVGLACHVGEAPAVSEKKDEPKAVVEVKRKELFKNITIETEGDQRRVRINAEVCLREGLLEQLLTRKRQKEHEAILAADIDARHLHFALLAAGAKEGKPVQFRPKLAAPTGTTVKIFLEYKKDGKEVRIPAQQWIKNFKTKKDLHTDWIFAGSVLIPDPQNPKGTPFYGANDGDVISIVNFESACLDVPFLSTKDNADLDFVAHTERIPALKTPVTIILEPVVEKKKEKEKDKDK